MNNLLEQTLIDQNPHWDAKSYDHQYERIHNKEAIKDLNFEEIQIVTGIRRSGKSTSLQALINQLLQQHDPKSILYINLDDPNYTDIWNRPTAFYDIVIAAEKLTTVPIQYLFLDEIQNVIAWEQYVKSVYDSKKFKKIIVTGSNADLLNSDYATLLSGRHVKTHIYPLSYRELLHSHKITNKLQLAKHKAKALNIFDGLLHFGGFPRVCTTQDTARRHRLLQSYYETILLKDCINNHKIRDTRMLMNLSHYMMTNISSCFSYNSISRALGSNENTMQHFIQIFQNAYFISELKQFSYSAKDQPRSKKKIYCIDNGLINAATFKFSNDYGKLFENLVYSELLKNNYENICFYNDQKECDFIAFQGKTPIAIQACYDLNSINQEREINGLNAAMEKFSISTGLIITYDQEKVLSKKIKIMPFWKFFGLENS